MEESQLKDIRLKPVAVMLDKARHLMYDLNAFAELEEHFGSVENAFTELEKGTVKVIRKFIHIGVQHEEEGVTEKQIFKGVGMAQLTAATDAIKEAVQQAMPPANPDPNVQAPTTAAVTEAETTKTE